MAEFKYALTRVCLRSGTLTLPRNMQDLFPESGSVEVLDTKSNEIHALTVRGPRTIAGLGPMFAQHGLQANDALIIRPLDDGTFAITPAPRHRQPDFGNPDVVTRFLEDLVASSKPLTEAEIRALHPYVPADFDLRGLLERDARLTLSEGRWQAVAAPTRSVREEQVEEDGRVATAASESDDLPAGTSSAWAGVEEHRSAGPNLERAGLNSEQQPADLGGVTRARAVLEHIGFRVEGLGHGQLMAHAELGRRTYKALVHVLAEGQRLDWASLLARRRDTGARYVAVFGDHRDLVRLHAPAELARATLWSWAGVQRMIDLSRTVLVSPIDMETHFERGGLYEQGLQRFEQAIAKRVEQRGAFSSVLAKLASMRAPTIFLLEDLAGDVDLQRDQLLRILERLGEAPFHLVDRVDSGEFCLRYRVTDALTQVSEYALSLRDRLPDRKRERVVGFAEEESPAEDLVPRATAPALRSFLAVPLFEYETSRED